MMHEQLHEERMHSTEGNVDVPLIMIGDKILRKTTKTYESYDFSQIILK